jgi:hypothetical protein
MLFLILTWYNKKKFSLILHLISGEKNVAFSISLSPEKTGSLKKKSDITCGGELMTCGEKKILLLQFLEQAAFILESDLEFLKLFHSAGMAKQKVIIKCELSLKP